MVDIACISAEVNSAFMNLSRGRGNGFATVSYKLLAEELGRTKSGTAISRQEAAVALGKAAFTNGIAHDLLQDPLLPERAHVELSIGSFLLSPEGQQGLSTNVAEIAGASSAPEDLEDSLNGALRSVNTTWRDATVRGTTDARMFDARAEAMAEIGKALVTGLGHDIDYVQLNVFEVPLVWYLQSLDSEQRQVAVAKILDSTNHSGFSATSEKLVKKIMDEIAETSYYAGPGSISVAPPVNTFQAVRAYTLQRALAGSDPTSLYSYATTFWQDRAVLADFGQLIDAIQSGGEGQSSLPSFDGLGALIPNPRASSGEHKSSEQDVHEYEVAADALLRQLHGKSADSPRTLKGDDPRPVRRLHSVGQVPSNSAEFSTNYSEWPAARTPLEGDIWKIQGRLYYVSEIYNITQDPDNLRGLRVVMADDFEPEVEYLRTADFDPNVARENLWKKAEEYYVGQKYLAGFDFSRETVFAYMRTAVLEEENPLQRALMLKNLNQINPYADLERPDFQIQSLTIPLLTPSL